MPPRPRAGLIRREVTRVINAGNPSPMTTSSIPEPPTISSLWPPHGNPQRGAVGVAWVELSTGLFQAADVDRDRLADELNRLAPSEVFVGEMAATAEAAGLL